MRKEYSLEYSLRRRALNQLSLLCLAYQLTHISYISSVVGVSLSEYGTYHMLCGIGVWYRGFLTSTSTGAQYRCIPKNLLFDSPYRLFDNFVTIHTKCNGQSMSPLRYQSTSCTSSALPEGVSLRGEGNSGWCFFELVVGSVMAMQAADSGCLLSIRASLKANNSRPVQAIYFISVCETTSRRDSTRLITLNQHCPHFIRSSYYMTAWVLIQPTRRDSIQHDSYRTDSSREHWPILEIKFNI